MTLPKTGTSKEAILESLEKYRENDTNWRSGRTWGYIFDAGKEAEEVAKAAYMMYLSENALDPTVFPSLLRFENELVAMGKAHVNGGDDVVGSFTTGGTESILLAVKTARDHNRKLKPHITQPEMILPITAHAAFHKASHYLGVKVVAIGVDPVTFKANADELEGAITENTILIVGSAPSYAHGVIDPIEEMAAIALRHEVLFHVDACMGGWLLPYFRRLGEDIPPFDFSVPGVTSLSMDLHKYAYAAKGASLILYKNKELRRSQIFSCAGWTGYSVVNPTIGSSKSGGPLAAAWAVLNFLGDDGYLELARKKLECMKALVKGITAIPELRVLGNPQMSLVCFTSDVVDPFQVIDEMKVKGWYIQPQLAMGPSPKNIHLSINASNTKWTEELLVDLRTCVEIAKGIKDTGGPLAAMVRASFSNADPEQFGPETFSQMLTMAGIKGVQLPGRMAEINEVMNALPPRFRELLLIEFINELFC